MSHLGSTACPASPSSGGARSTAWLVLLPALLVALLPGLTGCQGSAAGDAAAPGSATSASVTTGHLCEVLTATGTVVPRIQVKITCKASGRVVAVPVQPGSVVRRGDVLLELDPADEQRSVDRAVTALASAKARVDQARLSLNHEERSLALDRVSAASSLSAARLAADDARVRATRLQQLADQGLISEEERSAAAVTAANAASQLAAALQVHDALDARQDLLESRRTDVALAEALVKGEELSLGDAQSRLAETRVLAPMDGTVLSTSVEVGQLIASAVATFGGSGSPVMTIADLSNLQVKVTVPESDIGRLKAGQSVTVASEAWPGRTFAGSVLRVSPAGTRDPGNPNKVGFESLIGVTDRNAPLMPEMTVIVDVVVVDAPDAILVPVQAVKRHGAKATVQVRSGTTTTDREVVLGGTDGEQQQILSGLTVGEEVALQTGTSRWSSW